MRSLPLALCLALTSLPIAAQTRPSSPGMPFIDRTGVHPALMVDGKPYLMLAAQMNNSSAWEATMPAVWSVMDKLGTNTLEAPIYWEALEPTEGKFDFAEVDMLLTQARAHNHHLVLLWFGTWKNGSPGYTPEWVKRDPKRFPLMVKSDGTPVFSLSAFGTATLEADKRAFAALMGHLKERDPQHTVLMVQVENESGVWGATRDKSAEANRLFGQEVPREVLRAMGKEGAHGSWETVFGPDAEEVFYAWAVSRYIGQVAAAGKAIYPLPMYVNAELRDPLPPGGRIGSFESGGPTYDVLTLWHAMAPALDAVGPDIYLPEAPKVAAVLDQYEVPWNALLVPEIGNGSVYAHYFFESLGHGAMGFGPFGMDATGYVNYPVGAPRIDDEAIAPFVLNYKIAAQMAEEIPRWNQEGRVYGVAEDPGVHAQTIQFAKAGAPPSPWTATVSYGLPSFFSNRPAPGNAKPEGEALIVALGPDEFLVTGVHCRVDFAPSATNTKGKQRMWIAVEEGSYEGGVWKARRLWNGDQTDYGLNFTSTAQVLRVRLMAY